MSIWLSKQEAADRIDELVDRAHAGEDFIITQDGEPIVHLVPADGSTLGVVERDIREGIADAEAGRVIDGKQLVNELLEEYQAAFGSPQAAVRR